MPNQDISKELIADKLYEFLEKHFDDFGHKYEDDWWFTPSWSPFLEACFLIWGKELKYKVGASYTQGNISDFLAKINYVSKAADFIKPIDRGFDSSWHTEKYKFILGLEHEESKDGVEGSSTENNIKNICDEIEKLRSYEGKFKIITTRPRRRKLRGRRDTYSEVIEYYKEKLSVKLSEVNPLENETWVVIMIAPESSITKKQSETQILFYSYVWDKKEKELTLFKEQTFDIYMDDNFNIKRKI